MVTVTDPDAIGWKHNHESGIRCKQTDDVIELTDWPGSLGAFPSQADVDAWQAEYAAVKDDMRAADDIRRDKLARLQFEVNFDQENRVRSIEGRPPINKQQYKTAWLTTYKGL